MSAELEEGPLAKVASSLRPGPYGCLASLFMWQLILRGSLCGLDFSQNGILGELAPFLLWLSSGRQEEEIARLSEGYSPNWHSTLSALIYCPKQSPGLTKFSEVKR